MPAYHGPDGTALAYDLIGPREHSYSPVIVLPGGPARDPVYLGDLGGLARNHLLALVHPRGVGRSPAPTTDADGSAWEQAHDVDALRRALELDRTVVLAHSAAARTAIGYAVAYPDRVAGLCFVTPSIGFLVGAATDAEALIATREGEPAFDAAVRTLRSPQPDDDAAFTAWQRAAAPAGYAHWGDVQRQHSRTGRWSRSAGAAFMQQAPPGLVDRLADVTAPVLVVAGGQDVFTGTAGPARFADMFPAGQMAVIDDCGHYPWVERPDAFRTVVEGFLNSIR